jgi:hypothetical protein
MNSVTTLSNELIVCQGIWGVKDKTFSSQSVRPHCSGPEPGASEPHPGPGSQVYISPGDAVFHFGVHDLGELTPNCLAMGA